MKNLIKLYVLRIGALLRFFKFNLLSKISVIILITLLCSKIVEAQGVGINLGGAAPDASAGLDVDFTDRGMLIPRVTTAQRDAINGGTFANSLMIYNTTDKCFQAYLEGQWQNIFCSSTCSSAPATPGAISGNTTVCSSAAGESYSISSVVGATSYLWSVPATVSITAGQGSTGIVVDYAASAGDITVTASNSCGASAGQTQTITINAAPSAPVATAASGVVATSITANWNAVGGATTYYLDVATDAGFTSMVAGFNNLNVGNVTSKAVTGLTCATTYYYRVRVATTCMSISSNTITQASSACPPSYPAGTVYCIAGGAAIVTVTGSGGAVWMDRNLGADQAAVSSSDVSSYGSLYQFGRFSDGHQCSGYGTSTISGTTATLSPTETPGHANFITNTGFGPSWLQTPSTTAAWDWQVGSNANNPCPSGFRLPTVVEWSTEYSAWGTQNAAGAIASPLKLPLCGIRMGNSGSLALAGSNGYYWTYIDASSNTGDRLLIKGTSASSAGNYYKAYGMAVRCIKQ